MIQKQTMRALVFFALVVAALVFARQILFRGAALRIGGGGAAKTTDGRWSFVAPKLLSGDRTRLLGFARDLLEGTTGAAPEDRADAGRRIVFLSLSRPDRPALVTRGEGESLGAAVSAAAADLAARASASERRQGRLKIDLAAWRSDPETFDDQGRARIDRSLEGLWLPGPDLLLLPEELLARRLVNSDGDLQSRRLRRYLAEGNRPPVTIEDNPGKAGMPYFRVRFDSFTESGEGLPKRLFRGNDRSPEVSAPALLEVSRQGGEYLLRHQRDDGSFGYNYQAKRDEYDEGYNLLRHAGTCYALGELSEATGDGRYLEAARRGLEWLLATTVRGPKQEHAGAGFEAVVSPDEEAKLGGAALAILAVLRYQQTAGDEAWADRLSPLARFLLFQQDADGHFRSKYFYGPPDPEPFESIYYPGEAILALARLHRHDGRREWLAASRRGADWLIDVRDRGKSAAELPHDHWLLMGLEELHDLTADPRYLEHARRIAQAILEAQRTDPSPLDWVGTFYRPPRSAPTATRAEALVAMHRLAQRNGFEPQPYLEALVRMAAFQRRCQLTPENVLYLPRPERALGGFRRSLTHWGVRIDYVQHNVSALLGLRSILLGSA